MYEVLACISKTDYHGASVRDGIMYVTISPCLMCAKMIINAGIKEVVYVVSYAVFLNAANDSVKSGLAIPFSQMMAVISSAGVTSKAGA